MGAVKCGFGVGCRVFYGLGCGNNFSFVDVDDRVCSSAIDSAVWARLFLIAPFGAYYPLLCVSYEIFCTHARRCGIRSINAVCKQ